MSQSTPGGRTQQSMEITEEQEKLLYNATRVRILRALNNRSMTAQQIAEALGATKGNVHYHVQRLYEGGLLDLVETRPSGGVLEKYYQAKASLYTRARDGDASTRADVTQQVQTTLTLSASQLQQLNEELVALLLRFEEQTVARTKDNGTDYVIQVTISRGPLATKRSGVDDVE